MYRLEGSYFYYIMKAFEEGEKWRKVTSREDKLAVSSDVSQMSLSY